MNSKSTFSCVYIVTLFQIFHLVHFSGSGNVILVNFLPDTVCSYQYDCYKFGLFLIFFSLQSDLYYFSVNSDTWRDSLVQFQKLSSLNDALGLYYLLLKPLSVHPHLYFYLAVYIFYYDFVNYSFRFARSIQFTFIFISKVTCFTVNDTLLHFNYGVCLFIVVSNWELE